MKKTGPVEIVRPSSLTEAVEQVAAGGLPLAGGTDLFLKIRKGAIDPRFLVYLGELPELRTLEVREGEVEIGAALTHAEILKSDACRLIPILGMALTTVGAPAIREMGTLAGNLANASPAGDGVNALYLLEARVRLVGPAGERELPVEEFVLGPGKVDLRPGEIIRSLVVPIPPAGAKGYFRKVGRRRALVIAVASLGALVWSEDGLIRRARLALGSVAPTVLRPREVEEELSGKPLSPEALRPLASVLSELVEPITDIRASADYRRRVAGNLLLDMARALGG